MVHCKHYKSVEKIHMNKIIVISGMSGAGKDSVIKQLQKEMDFAKVITTASRSKRIGEVEGVDYYFISKKAFEQKIHDNKMLEWKEVYGEYKGISMDAFTQAQKTGKPILLKLDFQGTKTLKIMYHEALTIGIKPPSLGILKARVMKRKQAKDEDVSERMREAENEFKEYDLFDKVVINKEGKLKNTVEEVKNIITNHINA